MTQKFEIETQFSVGDIVTLSAIVENPEFGAPQPLCIRQIRVEWRRESPTEDGWLVLYYVRLLHPGGKLFKWGVADTFPCSFYPGDRLCTGTVLVAEDELVLYPK